MSDTTKTMSPTAAMEVTDADLDARKVDLGSFEKDALASPWVQRVTDLVHFPPIFLRPIDTLSVTKTVGKGRTNLTLIMATIMQADATSPYAGFDRRATPSRNPIVQIHFEPGAYGITSPGTYFVDFLVETVGASTFTIAGYAGAGTISGLGTRTVNGRSTISVAVEHLPSSGVVYIYIQQTAGSAWNWFATSISHPPIVFQPFVQE